MKFSQVIISAIALSNLPLACAPGPAARTLPHAPTMKITASVHGLNRAPVRPRNVEGFRPRGGYRHYYTGEPYRHYYTGEPYWHHYTGEPYWFYYAGQPYYPEFGAEYAPPISPTFGETIGGATAAGGGGWTTVTDGTGAVGYQYYPSGGIITWRDALPP